MNWVTGLQRPALLITLVLSSGIHEEPCKNYCRKAVFVSLIENEQSLTRPATERISVSILYVAVLRSFVATESRSEIEEFCLIVLNKNIDKRKCPSRTSTIINGYVMCHNVLSSYCEVDKAKCLR